MKSIILLTLAGLILSSTLGSMALATSDHDLEFDGYSRKTEGSLTVFVNFASRSRYVVSGQEMPLRVDAENFCQGLNPSGNWKLIGTNDVVLLGISTVSELTNSFSESGKKGFYGWIEKSDLEDAVATKTVSFATDDVDKSLTSDSVFAWYDDEVADAAVYHLASLKRDDPKSAPKAICIDKKGEPDLVDQP
jgi:hypothetical protein